MRTYEERQLDLKIVRAKLEKLGFVEGEICDDWVRLERTDNSPWELTNLCVDVEGPLPTEYEVSGIYDRGGRMYLVPDEVSKLLPEFRFCRFYWRTDLKDPLDK